MIDQFYENFFVNPHFFGIKFSVASRRKMQFLLNFLAKTIKPFKINNLFSGNWCT